MISTLRRVLRGPDFHHGEVPGAEPTADYRGPATLDAPDGEVTVTVVLNAHHDPIDGQSHWYGRISAISDAPLPEPGRAQVFLTVPGGHATPARLTERDPWGNLRIVGLGEPPYS